MNIYIKTQEFLWENRNINFIFHNFFNTKLIIFLPLFVKIANCFKYSIISANIYFQLTPPQKYTSKYFIENLITVKRIQVIAINVLR